MTGYKISGLIVYRNKVESHYSWNHYHTYKGLKTHGEFMAPSHMPQAAVEGAVTWIKMVWGLGTKIQIQQLTRLQYIKAYSNEI